MAVVWRGIAEGEAWHRYFHGIQQFCRKKVRSVTCKYVTQSKYISKREAKQKYRPTTRAGYGSSFATMKFSRHRSSVVD